MKFQTTKEDYEKACREVLEGGILDECCLLSQTIKRILPGSSVKTGYTGALIDGVSFQLPPHASEAVSKFDLAFTRLRRSGTNVVRDGFSEIEFELPLEETDHAIRTR